MTDLDMEKQHKFWNTQPVVQEKEKPKDAGVIDTCNDVSKVPKDPLPLPKGFSWVLVDTKNPEQRAELYDFLCKHYVIHPNNTFQFAYSEEFLDWALHPPGWLPDWHIGVRHASGKLVGFISATPITVRIQKKVIDDDGSHHFEIDTRNIVAVDFLSVHNELRGKSLAPVLIQEVTRRVHLQGIFEAIFTAGKNLTPPFTTAQYHHRFLNYEKLVEIKFTARHPGQDIKKAGRQYNLSPITFAGGEFREMRPEDVPQVTEKLNKYLEQYKIAQVFSQEEVAHNFLPRKNIVGSYVLVENDQITNFFSFYIVPSTVKDCVKYNSYTAAYVYYYFCTKSQFTDIAKAAMYKAKEDYQADVFNCLDILENKDLLNVCKFVPGDGKLNYYLFNYRVPAIEKESCGVVLL